MEYQTHNDVPDNESMEWWDGSHLQGYAGTHYDALVRAFGEPTTCDGFKVDWQWLIKFDDGTVATVYNWKNGPNYLGNHEGKKPNQITQWHVGGKADRALTLVREVLSCPTQSDEERMAEWRKNNG